MMTSTATLSPNAGQPRRWASPHRDCPPDQRSRAHEVIPTDRHRGESREAFELLVREHGSRLLAVARRILRSEDDAADALQDALLAAFVGWGKYQGNSQPYTWLYRIVVNACLMKLRWQKRRGAASLDALLPIFDDEGRHVEAVAQWNDQAAAALERSEMRSHMRACIDMLPTDYRTILLLRDVEEFDTDQTCLLLDLSRSAVKTRLHRARQALRALLERTLPVTSCRGGRDGLNPASHGDI
jgi:RNA polymerase sigma-70 factor (ECF subfamily)